MKKQLYRVVLFSLFSVVGHATVPYIALRSQSNNLARAFTERRIGCGDCATASHALGVTVMYQKSWKPASIGHCLFGADLQQCGFCEPSFFIQGSRFKNGNRDPQAWLADYFGLPTDFSSIVSFNPQIKTIVAEVSGWAAAECGFFIDARLPVVHIDQRLNASEKVVDAGSLGYAEGYFAAQAFATTDLLSKAEQFFNEGAVPDLGPDIVFHPLCVSKWAFECPGPQGCTGKLKRVQLSDVIVRVGKELITTYEDCFTLYVRASGPAGNKPKGIFLFEPVVGNGGHWGLGIGGSAYASLWSHPACGQALYLLLDGYVQHLFSTQQRRSFDLVGKPNSRYMLAQRLGTQRQDPSLSGPSDAGVEFQNEYAPIANLTYGAVNVSVAAEGELMVRLMGCSRAWQGTLGYNFWGRSGEHIRYAGIPCGLQRPALWAIKGDAQVVGFRITDSAPVRLAAVEDADIHSGTNNFPDGINGVGPQRNPGIINPVIATTGAGVSVVALPLAALGSTRSSNPVDFITMNDIDARGTRGISNSFFAYAAYVGGAGECSVVEPRLEIGGQVEFGKSSCCPNPLAPAGCAGCISCKGTITPCKELPSNCSSHSTQECAISTWGVWLTLGLGF